MNDIPESWEEVIHGKNELLPGERSAGERQWYENYYSGLSDKNLEGFKQEFSQSIAQGWHKVYIYSTHRPYSIRDDSPKTMSRVKMWLEVITGISDKRNDK